MKIYLKKSFYNLCPCDDDSLEKIKKLKTDETYYVDVKIARNYEFHKKYFSLMKLAYENQDKYEDPTSFRYEVTMRAGFYKTHITSKGTTLFFPDSIAFDKMTAEQFEELFSKSVDIILKHFVPADKKDLIDEVLSYCD